MNWLGKENEKMLSGLREKVTAAFGIGGGVATSASYIESENV
jgi:hypothetical protein